MNRKSITIIFLYLFSTVCPLRANVSITASDAAGGVLQINYAITGDSVVRGIALALSDAGLPTAPESEVAAVTDLSVVQLSDGTGLSWAYIDYYFSNTGYLASIADETELPGTGAHALADSEAAGVLTPPASAYSVSLGVLDNTGAQGGLTGSGVLCTIQLTDITANSDGLATINIAEDSLRGGIVGDNLGTVSVQASQDISDGWVVCSGMFTGTELTQYNRWAAAGKEPFCWCWRYQCRGDCNGDKNVLGYRIYGADLDCILASWRAKVTAANANPCADIAHDQNALGYAIYGTDLNILVVNWRKKDSALMDCPSYIP